MPNAIRIHETGGPDAMRWEAIDLSNPGPGEVRVRHTAIGLNFIDTYHRSGLYSIELPAILGQEAAGVVEALGPDVSGWSEGDRVAYAVGPMGAYCEARNYPADKLLKLPEEISDEVAATVMLKGMTAEYLANRTAHLSPGDPILIHAAAGGTGLLLSQWAKHLGATVIGTVGSEEKAELAKAHGCDHVILYRSEDVAKRVMEITDGAGVKVSYDSVGKDTFQAPLDALAPMGMFVSFGQASGPITPFVPAVLAPKCLYFTRPTLFVYNRTRQLLEASVGRLFEVLSSGVVKSEVRQTYALHDAAQAHRDLEGRQTQGATVLKP